MKLKLICFFIIFSLIFPAVSICTEFSVGVSPRIVEVGNMEKGESRIVKFHIVTVSSDPLLVSLGPVKGSLDFFPESSYSSLVSNFSEEETTGWLNFFKNPVELIPKGNASGAGVIKASEEISVLLSVPDNAEPGYHLVSVKPTPYVPEGSAGAVGAMIVAITSVNFIFNVEGNAKREGFILDVVNSDYSSGVIKLKTYFMNTGTDTISVTAYHKLYDKNWTSLADGSSTKEYVKPQETKIFEAPIMADLPFGEYNVVTTVDYTTGTLQMNSTISLERPITPAAVAQKPEHISSLWILIILIIIILSVAIYRWKK